MDVIRIQVRSLRERREDIPLLAERFMQDLSREYGRQPRRFAPDCLAALTSHPWPGEQRELRNLIERLLIFADGSTIRARDLPQELGGARAATEDLYRSFESLQHGLEAFERYYVGRMMTELGGDAKVAAERLGLTSEALEVCLKRIGGSPG